MGLAKNLPCFINAYNYSYFGANWWLFGWSADALIALLSGFFIFIHILCDENSAIIQFKVRKSVAQMYSVAPGVFRCIS